MSGFTTQSNDHLIRSQLWSNQLKEVFEDELIAMQFVRMITELPDGDTLNIPSLGQAEIHDYVENAAIQYNAFDTGNFQFSISDYKSSATYITNKMKQDSYKMSELVAAFVPKMTRAIMKSMEVDLLACGPDAQTPGNVNAINGANHRFIGTGTNEKIAIKDFARAKYALQMANCPMENLVAVVHPSVSYELGTLTGLSDVTYNPKWEGIIESGLTKNWKFIKNVQGFDVYESLNLKVNTAAEQIGSPTAAAGVNNLFFSASADPFVGMIRQAPQVDSSYNKDRQRDEYVVTARYGFKLFRPEALVVVVTDTDQVYA